MITDEEIEEAYQAVDDFRKKVLELRWEMIDEKLSEEQLDCIADYLHDNFRIY